jgi:hypothetical protein
MIFKTLHIKPNSYQNISQRCHFLLKKDLNQKILILEFVGLPSEGILSEMASNVREFLENLPEKSARANFAQYFQRIDNPLVRHCKMFVQVDLLVQIIMFFLS